MIEIRLVPAVCKPNTLGTQLTKTVDAFVPSRGMAGSGTLTIKARYVGYHKWQAFYVRRPWWAFWQRKVVIPHAEERLQFIPVMSWAQDCNYVRKTEVSNTCRDVPIDLFGPSVMVVAYGLVENWSTALRHQGARSVYYLTTLPGDGWTLPIDETCIFRDGNTELIPPTPQQKTAAQRYRRDYQERCIAHAQGRTIRDNNRQWITPEENERQQQVQAEADRLWRARGLR